MQTYILNREQVSKYCPTVSAELMKNVADLVEAGVTEVNAENIDKAKFSLFMGTMAVRVHETAERELIGRAGTRYTRNTVYAYTKDGHVFYVTAQEWRAEGGATDCLRFHYKKDECFFDDLPTAIRFAEDAFKSGVRLSEC